MNSHRHCSLVLVATAVAMTTMAGCGDRQKLPFLGHWSGRFVVESIKADAQIKVLKRNELTGFIQFYATGDKFKIHLEGEQVAVDAGGTWALTKHSIQFAFSEVKIDDNGGIDQRDPNRAYLPAPDIKTAFSVPMALRRSPDNKSLTGLTTDIGPLTGHFEFTKDSAPH